jgi:hypothetical protein
MTTRFTRLSRLEDNHEPPQRLLLSEALLYLRRSSMLPPIPSISPWCQPIGSMYAIYGNIYHQYTPNVSIYIYHTWILWDIILWWYIGICSLGMDLSHFAKIYCTIQVCKITGWNKTRKSSKDTCTWTSPFAVQNNSYSLGLGLEILNLSLELATETLWTHGTLKCIPFFGQYVPCCCGVFVIVFFWRPALPTFLSLKVWGLLKQHVSLHCHLKLKWQYVKKWQWTTGFRTRVRLALLEIVNTPRW